ncbi:hypothetical protein [uncultured Thiothrix sp.]|uniref:hypothetical protein n=1 Tax=uncultured Thiothrix sp. TaxID=223185 RepID=UPI00262F1D37|nr:hypothetical protein [uncultured Thiothrix sp.]
MRTHTFSLRKYLGLSTSVLLLAASSSAAWAAPNVEFAIRWNTADDRYHVYMRPSTTPMPDAHLNGQVTIVVPHTLEIISAFKVSGLFSTIPNTTWSSSSRVNAPPETKGVYDYLSFTLKADQVDAFAWQANKEIEVFNFANTGKCVGPVTIMENNDPFNNGDNSSQTNPGNELSNIGWDYGENAYLGTYGGAANCSDSLDTDGDGLKNGLENQLGTNPNNPDTDGDGLNDGVEVNTTKTNPLKADTDGDGLSDGVEVNTTKTDPLKADTDGDGLSDGMEVNTSKTDPLKVDTDGDGLTDSIEVNTAKTDPLKTDTDGDGLSDSTEVNTTKTDPLKADTDGDGLSDGIEINTTKTDPLKADTDGDGLSDGVEVNINKSNPLVTDTDGDGLSDSYEVNVSKTDPLKTDTDGDGLSDSTEVNTTKTNPLKIDTDGDGLADNVEINTTKTDPTKLDSDADGVSDALEVGADPLKPLDTDADGKINALDGDDDNDGLLTSSENYNGGTPTDDDTDKDGKADYLDSDDDGDGKLSAAESNDPNKNGLPEDAVDSDGDGKPDYLDTNDADGVKGDLDKDGLTNEQELAIGSSPTDPDTDKDGILDGQELGTGTKARDTDGDGKVDILDSDDDNDGVPTALEDKNTDGDKNPSTNPLDTDADTVPNYLDTDDDGDKKLTASEDKNLDGDKNPATNPTDTDGDGIPDYLDAVDADGPNGDKDGDGLSNTLELGLGTNPNLVDSDADGIPDNTEVGTNTSKPIDSDADGKIDALDSDDDNDGVPTASEDLNLDGDKNPATYATNTDTDSLPNYLDADDDGDGLLTSSENYNGGTAVDDDTDKDGKADYLDNDDDNDGLLSANEGNDPNKNGLPDDALDLDQDGIVDYLDATVNSITLQMRAMLQGAFSSATLLMRDDLRSKGFIPTKQPYTAAPYNYTGTETAASTQFSITGNNAPVDWVLIELRSNVDGKTILQRKAALVQRDGDIVEADTGSTTLRINGAVPANYYVAIRHRNHLGVMTAAPLSLMSTPTMVDFTLSTTKTYGDVNGRTQSKGINLLWAGDVNMDSRLISNGVGQDAGVIYAKILSAPSNSSFSSNFVVSGYNATDLTLDGDSIFTGPNNDTNLLIANVLVYPGNTYFNANYIVKGQLP